MGILEAGYFGAETLKVNTLEAGLNSTAVMAFTRPEVTLQESVTCCSHSLGFRKRNLALDCWPLQYSISYTTLASNELQPLRV